MNKWVVFNQVTIIFIMVLAGIYAKKRNIIDNNMNKGLTSLLLNLTLPLNILASYNLDFSKDMLFNMFLVFIFGMVIHPVCYLLGRGLFRKRELSEKNVLIFITVFSNCGFMAFPLLESIYGKLGILYGSMFLGPFNLFIWTLGVMLYSSDKSSRSLKNVFNPGVIAVIAGMIIFLFSVKLPYPVQRSFEVVGGMTTPLSMMITGVIIADMNIREVFSSPSVYYVSVVRLLVIPLISLFILKLLGISGIVLGICVLIAAMPGAAMATVMAEKFDGNSKFASQNVFVTTILSLITIPVIAMLI